MVIYLTNNENPNEISTQNAEKPNEISFSNEETAEQKGYPLTVADMVRAMDDKELAEAFTSAVMSGVLQVGWQATEEEKSQFYKTVYDFYIKNLTQIVDDGKSPNA